MGFIPLFLGLLPALVSMFSDSIPDRNGFMLLLIIRSHVTLAMSQCSRKHFPKSIAGYHWWKKPMQNWEETT